MPVDQAIKSSYDGVMFVIFGKKKSNLLAIHFLYGIGKDTRNFAFAFALSK